MVLLSVGSVASFGLYVNHEIHRVQLQNLTPTAHAGVEVNTQNILLIGSTDRCALTQQNPAYGLCSEGVTGVNSDIVMILHLDPATHDAAILSIPRDLFVPNARSTGPNKIDAALFQGPAQLITAIQDDFGIPIQHFVELNFDTFANVVDALGGIRMYFPEPVYDAYSGLRVMKAGCLPLNGFEALQVVRARHLQYEPPSLTDAPVSDWPYDPESDLARIRRDHEFLRVLASAVARKGIGNPLTDERIISAVAPQLEVDSGFSTSDMVNLVLAFHGVDPQRVPEWTLPVVIDGNGSYTYDGGNYGDVEFPTVVQERRIIDNFLDVNSDTDTMTGDPLPAADKVSVDVVGDADLPDQATDVAGSLSALGFQVDSVSDAPPSAAQTETVISYASTSPKVVAAAESVARAMSGAVIMAEDPTTATDGALVTVQTGNDFSVNAPPSPSKGSSGHTVAIPQASFSSPGLTAPTAAVQSLQPWDPRSCTNTGGAGA